MLAAKPKKGTGRGAGGGAPSQPRRSLACSPDAGLCVELPVLYSELGMCGSPPAPVTRLGECSVLGRPQQGQAAPAPVDGPPGSRGSLPTARRAKHRERKRLLGLLGPPRNTSASGPLAGVCRLSSAPCCAHKRSGLPGALRHAWGRWEPPLPLPAVATAAARQES